MGGWGRARAEGAKFCFHATGWVPGGVVSECRKLVVNMQLGAGELQALQNCEHVSVVWQSPGVRVPQSRIPVPPLLLRTCVNLDKAFAYTCLSFLICKMGATVPPQQ